MLRFRTLRTLALLSLVLPAAPAAAQHDALEGHPNVATPHERIDDTLRAVAWRTFDNVGAAGAINSSARDMVRWVRFQLDSTRIAGKRLLKPATFQETRTPHIVIRRDSLARQANPYTH